MADPFASSNHLFLPASHSPLSESHSSLSNGPSGPTFVTLRPKETHAFGFRLRANAPEGQKLESGAITPEQYQSQTMINNTLIADSKKKLEELGGK